MWVEVSKDDVVRDKSIPLLPKFNFNTFTIEHLIECMRNKGTKVCIEDGFEFTKENGLVKYQGLYYGYHCFHVGMLGTKEGDYVIREFRMLIDENGSFVGSFVGIPKTSGASKEYIIGVFK